MTRQLLALITLLFFAGCVTGPPAEKKNILNSFNGANYETPADGSASTTVIPTLRRKERLSLVRGHVYLGEKLEMIPLKNLLLELRDTQNRIVGKTRSLADGSFEFNETLPNGFYALVADSNRYRAMQTVEIRDYETADLWLKAIAVAKAD